VDSADAVEILEPAGQVCADESPVDVEWLTATARI
jgi:hypothetical protein